MFQIEISKGILVLFVSHHTLIFGSDTYVSGSKILFCSHDVLVEWHRVLKLSFIDTFHTKLDLGGWTFSGKKFVQYNLLQKPIILSPLNSTLKSPGICLPWGASGVTNQLCLFCSNSSQSLGLIKSSTFSGMIPR